MNDVEKALETFKEQLDNHPLIQEFLKLKEAMKNDAELKSMRQEISRLKNENKNEEHKALLEIYNSHPIVSNYEETKSEVASLLKEIKTILSD